MTEKLIIRLFTFEIIKVTLDDESMLWELDWLLCNEISCYVSQIFSDESH